MKNINESAFTITSVTPAGEKFDRYAALKSITYVVLVVLLPVVSIATFLYSFLLRLAAGGFSGKVDASDHTQLLQTAQIYLIVAIVAGIGALIMSLLLLVRHRSTWRIIVGVVVFVISGFVLYFEVSFLTNLLAAHTS